MSQPSVETHSAKPSKNKFSPVAGKFSANPNKEIGRGWRNFTQGIQKGHSHRDTESPKDKSRENSKKHV